MNIPQPKPKPIVGNLLDIDPNNALKSVVEIAKNYDGIFQLSSGLRGHWFGFL